MLSVCVCGWGTERMDVGRGGGWQMEMGRKVTLGEMGGEGKQSRIRESRALRRSESEVIESLKETFFLTRRGVGLRPKSFREVIERTEEVDAVEALERLRVWILGSGRAP